MNRLFIAHRILHYLSNNTSEKYSEWRSVTIDFLYGLFQIIERNPGINLTFLKSVGMDIHHKNQMVLYLRFNKRFLTVYISPGFTLYKICEDHWKPKLTLPTSSYKKITIEIDRVFNAWNLFIQRLDKENYIFTDILSDMASYKTAFMNNVEAKRIYELGK